MSQELVQKSADTQGFFRLIASRPVAVLMIFLAEVVFGWVSYAQLPLNLMPDLSYPTLTVRTEYAGAAPEEVEAQVSRLVEEALSTSDGLVGIQSRSRAELSDVVLEFDWGTDMSGASQGVRERIQTIWFGDGIDRPLILHYDPSLDPILRVALSTAPDDEQAPSGTAALFMLRELADQEIKRELEALDGVAAVRVRGGLERQVSVEVREDWLAARGVTLDQVTSVLLAENVNIAGGSIREGDTEFLIRTLNEFSTLEEIRDLEVPRSDGTRVPIEDLATVRETWKERQVVSHLGGREAVELEVFKEADANIVEVARRVKQHLGETPMPQDGMGQMTAPLRDRLPDGVVFSVLDDQASFIEDAISNLFQTAMLGGFLAVGILFLFLRDVRSTAIIASSIPISVICTFAALHLGGVTLNLMSLGGLALGIGMLVDNSVVVLEAIAVHREAGLGRKEAAIKGTREVAAAVIASTLTTVAVFVPIVFVEGVAGQIFGDLAMAVVFSLLSSLQAALVLVPMLAAREVVRPQGLETLASVWTGARFGSIGQLKESWSWNREKPLRFLLLPYQLFRFSLRLPLEIFAFLFGAVIGFGGRAVSWVGRLVLPWINRVLLGGAGVFQSGYQRLADRYPTVLRAALDRPGSVLGGAALALFAAFLLSGAVGQELIPEVHQGRFTVATQLPVGTPLDKTVAVTEFVESTILADLDVAQVYSAIGSEGRADARADEGEHSSRVLVQLEPGGDLAGRQAEVAERIRSQLSDVENLDVRIETSSLFTVRTPVEVVVSGQDLDELRIAADAVVDQLTRIGGLRDVRSSLVPGFPEIRIRYQRDLLDRFGLTTRSVATAVRDKVQGAEASRLARGERRVDMVVQLVEADRSSLEDLGRINVNPALDPPIPLSAVAVLEEAAGPSEIRRVDQRRAAVVSANLEGLDLASTQDVITNALRGVDLPSGYDWELAGQTLEMQRSLRSLAFALLLAVFLVYVIMASTFESLTHPFVILFSVPLAAVGVLPALAITGSAMSVVVFIGLIVLAGMVVNNAIVLIDRVNQGRAEGLDAREAVLVAGRARLRPILITTFTTALGLLPLSLGIGAGAEMQQPLALTVIAGLVSSTLLTLVVVPVVYLGSTRLLERPA
ncbi:MAG: efflux RND transporter permease subunit [Proteobacteria bacterium]|nr:efflux RND transporter permease subunit [Pseudomonadota bacterium]